MVWLTNVEVVIPLVRSFLDPILLHDDPAALNQ